MTAPAPLTSLPLRRRRHSRWPVIVTLLIALGTVAFVTAVIQTRPQPTPVPVAELVRPPKVVAPPAKPKQPAKNLSSTLLATKNKAPLPKPVVQKIPALKAMPASEVRVVFDQAASVLRQYFQSPSDETLHKLVRHPEETMPRHREWARTRRIVPAVPLQIGPQFGVSGSMLLTGVKLNDGSMRMAALEKTNHGYQLDWESFSAWGESRFVDLYQLEPGKTALMRVTIKPSSATPPASAAGGASFTVSHPDERTTLAAYATAEILERTPAGRSLGKANGGMFTVRLAVNAEDVKSGMARIHEVVASGWLPDMEKQAAVAKE